MPRPPETGTIGGIEVRAILERLPAQPAEAVWLSGSLVEGLGNSGSDVDVFAAVEAVDPGLAWVRPGPPCWIYVTVLEGRRIDFEFWPLETLSALAAKLAGLPLDDPASNLLNVLSPVEVDLIHRLKVGRPVRGADAFERIREAFDFSRFRRYLVGNQIRYVDDAFDDTVGMLESGDLDSAVLRARFAAELSVDVLLYAHDVTNDKAKYRARKLRRLCSERPRLWPFLHELWRFEGTLPADEAGRVHYVEEALRFSSRIVEEVQAGIADREPSIDLGASPQRHFGVRKRKSFGKTYLVHLSSLYAVEPFSETVWDLCDGNRSILEIASALAAKHPETERLPVFEKVVQNVRFFTDRRLMTI